MFQRRNNVSDDQIVSTYDRAKSARKTAQSLGISEKTVYRVLERHGIERVGHIERIRRAQLRRPQCLDCGSLNISRRYIA